MLMLYGISTNDWDATHPSHRGCFIGHPCYVTRDKSCAGTSYLSKLHHAYGTYHRCYCSNLPLESEKLIFPDCADCGVLVDNWDLILINCRVLDDKRQVTTADDRRLMINSNSGYINVMGYGGLST
ncbi:hypothetical protein LX36DRAFT_737252 [Colletotrichum falcatum]|nr:hypothetical protein LX36DRAFT_737252 [Colletotrichum falcatum]